MPAINLRTYVERLIQRLKHDPSYHLDPNLSTRTLLQILHYRGIAYGRGLWYRLWLRSSPGAIFVGDRVQLLFPQYIDVGHSVILEDHVVIDALSTNGVVLGDNVTIARNTTIKCTGVVRNKGVGIVIGSNSAVGAYSFLGAQGGIRIGSDVIMGPGVSLYAENHRYYEMDRPIRLQGESRQGIRIGDDCWIGGGSIILDGVDIGPGTVVAAGSVVTKNVEAYSVVAGVPARVLKNRQAGESIGAKS
jgi:acetyltransferase-like isoleucine patch superfamily enzyme